MSYTVNPNSWGAVFPVPAQVVDKHIRLAGVVELKVILYVLRRGADGAEPQKIANDLKISLPDVIDALQYWVDAGILVNGENNQVKTKSEPAPEVKPKTDETQKKIISSDYFKPNMSQIISRCAEEPEIKFFFTEAQSILSKTIGHDGQSTLLMLYDSFGLPLDVILMLLKYCVSIGKNSFVYISKVGRDWGEKEIDTIEKADEQIKMLSTSNALFNELKKLAGISTPKPTNAQVKYLNEWKNELGYDIEMIYLAYEEMANNCSKVSFPYMDKILRNWHDEKMKTPLDVERAKNSRKNSKKPQKNYTSHAPSYNIDDFTKNALNNPLIYKNKEND